MKQMPDFMIEATNVYRTKHYIVKQDLYLDYNIDKQDILCSNDTYYLRNKHIDRLYESIFSNRKDVNGKRIHSTTYQRKYID